MVNIEEVKERVIKVTSQVLKIKPSEIKHESNFVFDLGAESVDSIELITAFEKEFNIEMEEESALEVQTVDKAIDYICERLEEKK